MAKNKIICYLLAMVAFGVFVLGLSAGNGDPIREQAIYWFGFAAVLFMFPDIKKFKIKELEIELREEIKRVEKQVGELSNTFFKSIERVWQQESEMPHSLREQRNKYWNQFQSYIDSLTSPERLEVQIESNLNYLNDFGISPLKLKEMLKQLNHYSGSMSNTVDEELTSAIEEFQRAENLKYVDGIFGPLTYKKMFELLSLQEKCGKVGT